MVLNILVWCFIVGFIVLAAYLVDNTDVTNTKAYKDKNYCTWYCAKKG